MGEVGWNMREMAREVTKGCGLWSLDSKQVDRQSVCLQLNVANSKHVR